MKYSVSATSRARTSFHMHVILERVRERASTVRFVPLPSTSSAQPPLKGLRLCTYVFYVNHVMASDELTKIPVFSTPTYASTLLHVLGHGRLRGVASNIEWFLYILAFHFAYLLAYRPAHSCAGCGSHPCWVAPEHMATTSTCRIFGGVGRFRSDKQHSRNKIVVSRITY